MELVQAVPQRAFLVLNIVWPSAPSSLPPPSHREVHRDWAVPRSWEHRSRQTWGDLWVRLVRWLGPDRQRRGETIFFNDGAAWSSPGLWRVSLKSQIPSWSDLTVAKPQCLSTDSEKLTLNCWLSWGTHFQKCCFGALYPNLVSIHVLRWKCKGVWDIYLNSHQLACNTALSPKNFTGYRCVSATKYRCGQDSNQLLHSMQHSHGGMGRI